jgi:hypothetical protein
MHTLINWVLPIFGAIVGGLLFKYVPVWLASEESKLMDKFLSSHDAADDELFLAIVKWADKKIPGSNQGHLKYQAAANLFAARFPIFSADKIDELIEKSVDQMKEAAEKKAAGKPPTQ